MEGLHFNFKWEEYYGVCRSLLPPLLLLLLLPSLLCSRTALPLPHLHTR